MAEDEADPSTPPPAPEFLPADVALPRIEAIVANARTVWLGQIGFLAFITVTLISVRDVDFFSVTATTDLPIINVAIPTTTFFWTAAWLGAVLHTYLHLFLLRLWDALAEAPADLDGLRLGERVFPWLVNDWALRRRPDRPLETRPMDWLANTVTLVLVWLATPFVLVWFWWRSMPAHDAWLTLAIAGALGLSLFTSAHGWLRAKARLGGPGKVEKSSSGSTALPPAWRRAGIALGIILAALSLLRTEIGDVRVGPFRSESFLLASIDLEGAEIAVRPNDWRNHELARRRFRIVWCKDNGLTPLACETPEGEYLGLARATWCEANPITHCTDWFRKSDAAFAAEWEEERKAYLGSIIGPDLSGRDLRRASASGAFFAGINLYEARLEGADLGGAQLEGVNLVKAALAESNLFAARLEGAVLSEARLNGSNLGYAMLGGANLNWAHLTGVNLSFARLESAELFAARLEGADLSGAGLTTANLGRAALVGANLSGAWLEGANLSEAWLDGANLADAWLQGADLDKARLEGANLVTAVLTGANLQGSVLKATELAWGSLEGANLHLAQLQGANLSKAVLTGASLYDAELEGANFGEAKLEGADLGEARMQSAEWAGAIVGPSPAHWADFSDARNLTQDQLALVIGNPATNMPQRADGKQLLHVWSCWMEADAETYLQLWAEHHNELPSTRRAYIREQGWICPPGKLPLPVHMEPDETGQSTD